ncbi:hypothetical protein [Actinomadura rugatobispora]
MGDRSKRDPEIRFWKIRTTIEMAKLGIWIVWQTFRGGPGGLL